jgi:quinolinate synthase
MSWSRWADRVIFLPDQYLGRWVASQTDVELILWHGSCDRARAVHGEELRAYRAMHWAIQIIAHPECPPDVLAEADFVGSTVWDDRLGRASSGRSAS